MDTDKEPNKSEALAIPQPPIMPLDEVLQRLSDHGRGSIADVLEDDGSFNLSTAKERGKDNLIKKLRINKTTRHSRDGESVEIMSQDIELHSVQGAIELVGKHHGAFDSKADKELTLSDADATRLLGQLCAIMDEASRRKEIAEAAPLTSGAQAE